MKFIIINGLPYMVANGRAFPVKIKNGVVEYDETHSSLVNFEGQYTLQEIMAKCKNLCSIPKEKSKRRS